jgi:hypothetical protein
MLLFTCKLFIISNFYINIDIYLYNIIKFIYLYDILYEFLIIYFNRYIIYKVIVKVWHQTNKNLKIIFYKNIMPILVYISLKLRAKYLLHLWTLNLKKNLMKISFKMIKYFNEN